MEHLMGQAVLLKVVAEDAEDFARIQNRHLSVCPVSRRTCVAARTIRRDHSAAPVWVSIAIIPRRTRRDRCYMIRLPGRGTMTRDKDAGEERRSGPNPVDDQRDRDQTCGQKPLYSP
jgi:hypothetical protein